MLDAKQLELLTKAMDLLDEADALVQKALGATDDCYDTHCSIQNLIDDLQAGYIDAQNG
jgi:hypothetical protein